MQTRLASPLIALVLVLLAPAGAHAAMTVVRDVGTRTATITGDDAADTLTVGVDASGSLLTHDIPLGGNLESPTDWDAVEPGQQQIQATEDAAQVYEIVVNTGGGNDAVTITTGKLERVLADLGDGDDLFHGFTGSRTPDEIRGGAGDDRIAGGGAADKLLGGEGSDTLVWNNGDGSDEMDGEGGGFDTVEVNGSPTGGDEFIIRPGDGGKLRLDRVNLGLFFLSIATTTERVQVNGLGGNDKVETVGSAGVPMSLDGGTGDDTLIGAEAADTLAGGEDNDKLFGGGGDDVLAGNRGDDSMSGGEGSDTLVWNNGDNTDTADGDAGLDVLEVNGAGAGDAFTVRADGARARLERTNLVPFAIGFATEVLDLDTLGGDDTVTLADGTPAAADVDGGTGNDTLTGASGADVLSGGSGNDSIAGGTGTDLLSGDDGDDTIGARDEQGDAVRCGAGTDTATLDGTALDHATDCETAGRPALGTPGGDTGASAIRIVTRKAKVRKRRVVITLECPAGPRACAGSLSLATARAVRIGRARVIVTLGTARFNVAAGKTARVSVRLTRSLRAIARKAKSLRTRAVAATDAGGGATLGTTVRITLTKGARRW